VTAALRLSLVLALGPEGALDQAAKDAFHGRVVLEIGCVNSDSNGVARCSIPRRLPKGSGGKPACTPINVASQLNAKFDGLRLARRRKDLGAAPI
jgi:hypothetical protein